ncbi:MAG: hypothetical protein ISS36_02370 [Candidatus Aenigmarchaeota archaeon]|nr:hypothetical protein [Candidatus Aenigmarchaeota archaeon]
MNLRSNIILGIILILIGIISLLFTLGFLSIETIRDIAISSPIAVIIIGIILLFIRNDSKIEQVKEEKV